MMVFNCFLCFITGVLEVSLIQQLTYIDTSNDTWTHNILNFMVRRPVWETAGPLGGVIASSHETHNKINKLGLTEVELSLFAALLLFCSGNYTVRMW